MSIGHAFLGLLEDGPRHGYALKTEFDSWFGQIRPVRFGQVYATLARLETKGLAEISMIEAGEGPDRKRYAITPNGVETLESWLATPQSAEEVSLGSLYLKVIVALLSGRSADEILDTQRAVHVQRMRTLRRSAAGAGIERGLAVDYQIAHLQADLDWIALASERIHQARPKGGRR